MDNDYLRVNSKSDDAEIVTSEFDVKKKQVKTEGPKKLTVMSILFSGRKKHGQNLRSVPLPTFKGSFTAFLALSFLAVFVLFIAIITKTTELFIFDALLIALMIPIASITLFSDLDTRKNVSLTEIICAVVTGVFAYVLINFIDSYIVTALSDYQSIVSIVSIVFSDVFLFIISFFYVKLMKKDDIFAAILICIGIYSGYLVARTTINLITSLCVSVTVVSSDFKAIVFDGKSNEFGRAANSFVKNILSDGIYFPFLSVCWATICAGVIGLTALPFREVREHKVTYTLFLLIQIILHVVSSFTSTLRFYNVLISSLCFIVSLFCAVRMLNFSLSKSTLSKQTEVDIDVSR